MAKPKSKIRKPTEYQTRVLRMIAGSRLIKTHVGNKHPVWMIDECNIEISHECAQALIRNQWVKAERDGLPMFEESQSYTALRP